MGGPRPLESIIGRASSLIRRLPTGGRNSGLFIDTAVNSLAGLALMAMAARGLSSGALAEFAVGQMIVVTGIGLIRGGIWGPALAAQRQVGRSIIPISWSVLISAASSPVFLVVFALFFGKSLHATEILGYLLVSFLVCVQDGLRTSCISRSSIARLLWADITSLAVLIGLATSAGMESPSRVLLVWGASSFVGIMMMASRRTMWGSGRDGRRLAREAFRLGRWATIDGLLAATAALAPVYASFNVMASDDAGVYRLLLTVVGPLNIVYTTVLTTYGLDSWRLTDRQSLHALRRKTLRLSVFLAATSVAYLAFTLPLVVYVAKLQTSDGGWKEISLVGIYGVLSVASAPLVAGALALGYHRHGVFIRIPCIVAAGAISLVASQGYTLVLDPIGLSLAVTAALAILGWAISFRSAWLREIRLIADRDEGESLAANGEDVSL